jgi:hypothetical protein
MAMASEWWLVAGRLTVYEIHLYGKLLIREWQVQRGCRCRCTWAKAK